jgi:hypothetical protein
MSALDRTGNGDNRRERYTRSSIDKVDVRAVRKSRIINSSFGSWSVSAPPTQGRWWRVGCSSAGLRSEGPQRPTAPSFGPSGLWDSRDTRTGSLRCRLKFFRSSGPKTNPLTVIPSNEGSGSCQTSRSARIFGKIHYIRLTKGSLA